MRKTGAVLPSPSPRAPRHADLRSAIKSAAWKQIAEFGAPALSLRAIARALGVTAPAIYNYFRRRDDLVTALIKDAFEDFGDSQLSAIEGVPTTDLVGRLRAGGMAYRQWALKHPERYQLIFGAPIPGYVVPFEEVARIGARSMRGLLAVVEALRMEGRLLVRSELPVEPAAIQMFDQWNKAAGNVDLQSFTAAILIWAHVHGLVSLEIGRNLPPMGPSAAMLYDLVVESIGREFVKDWK